MLYVQAQHGLSFEQTEHLVRDRLSWMRFCWLSIADPVSDANTLWDFRQALIAKADSDGKALPNIAIPAFGCKSHISIDARHGFIRRQIVTDAAACDDARLREGLIDRTNTASSVWADTAYRSATNEAFLADGGGGTGDPRPLNRKWPDIGPIKPQERPMPGENDQESTSSRS